MTHRYVPTVPSVRHTPEQLRDAGLAAQEHHVDPRIDIIIDGAIEELAATGDPFSADDIRPMVPTIALPHIGRRVRSYLMRRNPQRLVCVGEIRSEWPPTHAKKIGLYVGAEHHEAEAPCNYHAALYEGTCPAPWVPALEAVQHWAGVHAAFMLRSTKAYRDHQGRVWERGDGDRWYYRGDALSSRTLDVLLRLNGPLTPVVTPPIGGGA